jgi:hypothetical protein
MISVPDDSERPKVNIHCVKSINGVLFRGKEIKDARQGISAWMPHTPWHESCNGGWITDEHYREFPTSYISAVETE